MPISLEEAIQQTEQLLSGFSGTYSELVQQISSISQQLSAAPVNSGTAILFSGVGGSAADYSGSNSNVNVLNETDVGSYLESDLVNEALRQRATAEGLFDPDARGGVGAFTDEAWAAQSSPDAMWGEASARYAQGLSGDVVYAGTLSPNGVFATIELPALLQNADITSINGIPVNDLRNGLSPSQITEELAQSLASQHLGNVVSNASHTSIGAEILRNAGVDTGLNFVPDGNGSIDIYGLDGRLLGFAGTVGDVIELGIAAKSAREQYNAGDVDGAIQTLADATAAVVLGALAAAAAMAIGAALSFATAPIILLGLAAGMATSFVWNYYTTLNSDWYTDLTEYLRDEFFFDPFVIDLDGDGIELSALGTTNAYFDLDGDGFAEQTGWVAPDDALLAIDANGNAQIDDISELFGSQLLSGFAQLSHLDSNGDGIIDAQDADFAQLLLWQDLDSDGQTDEGELVSLTEAGLVSIDLNATATNINNNGNQVAALSSVTWSDGSTSQAADVNFNMAAMETTYELDENFALNEDVLDLPWLRGYGEVRDSWVDMSDDAALRTAASNLVTTAATGDHTQFMTDFDTYLADWSGAAGWEWFDQKTVITLFLKDENDNAVGYLMLDADQDPFFYDYYPELDARVPGWRDLLQNLDATYRGYDGVDEASAAFLISAGTTEAQEYIDNPVSYTHLTLPTN